jgi:hypothetical protein
MRRLSARFFTASLIAGMIAVAIAVPASAASPNAGRGFLPAQARVHGMTLAEIAGAWDLWAFGSPAESNPLLANRCEASPSDPRIWFLPVSLGGDYEIECDVPVGAFLVLTPGGYECSTAEGNGETAEELEACVDANFANLTFLEVALDGRPASNLERYIVTSPLVQLPGPNLLGEDPTPSMLKSYFMIIAPLSPGEHTVRAFDEFVNPDFAAGITMNLTVD